MSQQALADEANLYPGVSLDRTAVARIEGGKRRVMLDEAMAFAEILGDTVQRMARLESAADEYSRLRIEREELQRVKAQTDAQVKSLQTRMAQLQRQMNATPKPSTLAPRGAKP